MASVSVLGAPPLKSGAEFRAPHSAFAVHEPMSPWLSGRPVALWMTLVIALWELSHADDVAKLASKVIQAVSQPFSIQGRGVSMTASVGVGIYPTHGEEVETLMKSADLALYEAKRTGKNDYRIAARTDLLAMARSCRNLSS